MLSQIYHISMLLYNCPKRGLEGYSHKSCYAKKKTMKLYSVELCFVDYHVNPQNHRDVEPVSEPYEVRLYFEANSRKEAKHMVQDYTSSKMLETPGIIKCYLSYEIYERVDNYE